MRRSMLTVLLALLLASVPLTPATAAPSEVSGSFDASADFATATFTPVGRNCLFGVSGEIALSGDIEGVATGSVAALVFAPCDVVLVNPPGAFRDVFRSELDFVGTVHGTPAEATITYQGRTEVGGAIDGMMILTDGLAGVLQVDAAVIVGGTYEGRVVVPG